MKRSGCSARSGTSSPPSWTVPTPCWWCWTWRGRVLRFNRAAEQAAGRPFLEAIGPVARRRCFPRTDRAALRRCWSGSGAWTAHRLTGTAVPVDGHGENGEAAYIYLLGVDITPLREAEEAQRLIGELRNRAGAHRDPARPDPHLRRLQKIRDDGGYWHRWRPTSGPGREPSSATRSPRLHRPALPRLCQPPQNRRRPGGRNLTSPKTTTDGPLRRALPGNDLTLQTSLTIMHSFKRRLICRTSGRPFVHPGGFRRRRRGWVGGRERRPSDPPGCRGERPAGLE